MSTFLFDKIIFGPIQSRRLGVSLGVNLLPTDVKVCSFNCVYCECGWNPERYEKKKEMPSREKVVVRLQAKLQEMQKDGQLPDVITFAGNGEPTMHPKFAEVIDDTVALRNQYAPNAKIAVLSNATMLHKKSVFEALRKVDDNIQKLDSAIASTIDLVDCPVGKFDVEKTVNQLIKFQGKVIIQTLFLRGEYKGEIIDNTTEKEVSAWLKLIEEIRPSQVMIYTIARDTPLDTLEKVACEEMEEIAQRVRLLGVAVSVSA